MPPPEPDPLVGTVVDGRYRVLARLSEGGMGVVYRAEHVFLKREVALKRLHRELTGHGEAVARFEREAQAAAQIDHPNVCQVLDCGVGQDGAFFIAMELLAGASLDRRIAEAAPLPLAEIADIGLQLCDALGRAHSLGIVHRDLKPENVMLVPRRDGPGVVAKIMDFGIAKVAQEGGGNKLTQAGMVFGTPAYMAPEQAAGTAVDARADLYALGVILFEMATGRCPFEAPTLSAVLTKQLTEDAPPLEAAAPQLVYPHPFRDLVARCLVKDPDRRFGSAAELAAALRGCAGLAAIPVTLPPAPVASPALAPAMPHSDATILAASSPSLPPSPGPFTTGITAPTVYPGTTPPRRSRTPLIVASSVAFLAVAAVIAILVGRHGSDPNRSNAATSSAAPTAGPPPPATSYQPRPERVEGPPATRLLPPTAGRVPPAATSHQPGPERVEGPPATSVPSPPHAWSPSAALEDLVPPPAPPTAAELLAAAAAERLTFETVVPDVADALASAAQGKVRDAVARLERLSGTLDGNAHYHWELAVLLQRDRKLPKAVEHALRAVEIDPRYAADPALLALGDAALAQRPSAEAAERFFERVLDADGAARLARQVLDSGRQTAVARRARDLLTRLGLLDGLPDYIRLPLLAVAAEDCTGRKEILAEIQARPDARMAPYLRRFKGESGCGILNFQDCWPCERSELRSALAAVDAAPAGGGNGADASP
ncbi:MAG: protein kinase [Deltaproteobacteria bacterium]|nr:protein kinase [Deltaproteobacteria bacterium]